MNDSISKENDITILTQSTNKFASPKKMTTNSTIINSQSLYNQEEFKSLERNFADIVLINKSLKNEIVRLEHELSLKISQIEMNRDKLQFYEQTIKGIEEENLQREELLKKEIISYKSLVKSLENEIISLNSIKPEPTEHYHELYVKYEKLLRDYKILTNQFELEKNQKLIYLDQLEFLSSKNEELIKEKESNTSGESSAADFITEITHATNHTMNELTDEEDSFDLLDQSSPIKQTPNFQFPPSPDPESRDKRQSLPTQLKRMSLVDNEFVLSPFKLTPTQEQEDKFNNSNSTIKRYSSSKPTHSRYNSHDIIPIKVEFEKENGKRSVSNKEDYRNETLFALNGYEEDPDYSRNFSIETTGNSNRSSGIYDKSTRQEITKLKFELQSLKLHNEKLLSYIGFELQKQKKNIKRLTKKQSEISLGSKVEYSDAKLIANSKDMLINKKRVLRSVSINTILDKKNINSIGLRHDNYDGDDEEISSDDKMIKKYASQVFRKHNFDNDSDFEDWAEEEIEDIEEEEEIESSSSSSEEELGVFNHLKHIVMGKKEKKRKLSDELVDDGLKFKFLTIALGIIIISFRLTPHAITNTNN
ncbi:unnamed protein product [Candida verbasci]|uniref:Uncharacterized protein n=1 Tax=Candida verbasci TaxID=1227364 RepID=A0A9W4U0M9_9ASCO|nr:unnamed protein product [Candida verbasci]